MFLPLRILVNIIQLEGVMTKFKLMTICHDFVRKRLIVLLYIRGSMHPVSKTQVCSSP